MACVLVVIDAQKSFVSNHNAHVLPKILNFIDKWNTNKRPIVFTQFVNENASPYEVLLNWTKCKEKNETDFAEEIQPLTQGHVVITKHLYSAFSSESFCKLVIERGWKTIVLCGFSTHACVLKTALDAFEMGLRPIVLSDLCGSHNGVALHENALTILPKLVGRSQIQDSSSFGM